MRVSPALFLFAAHAVAATPSAEVPTYTCRDGSGAVYRIWLGNQTRRLEWETPPGKVNRIGLASANLFRETPNPGEPLISNGWRPEKIKTDPIDMAYEVVTQFKSDGEKSGVILGLVVDHEERTGLECQGSGVSTPIVYFDKLQPIEVRLPERAMAVAGLRDRAGELTPIASGTFDTVVRRFFKSSAAKDESAKKTFFKNLSPAIVRVAANSVSSVGKKLPPEMKAFWVELLEATKYRYFPETERFAGWIKEGARPAPQRELDSVRAGFIAFMRSPLFQQKDLQEFFTRAVAPAMVNLEEFELNRLSSRMSAKEKAFVKSVWVKGTGRKTLDDFPEIAKMISDLNKTISAPEFDPIAVKDRLMVFFSSSTVSSPEARALYVQAAAPTMKKLSGRQQEDVNAWLNDAGKELFREMLR